LAAPLLYRLSFDCPLFLSARLPLILPLSPFFRVAVNLQVGLILMSVRSSFFFGYLSPIQQTFPRGFMLQHLSLRVSSLPVRLMDTSRLGLFLTWFCRIRFSTPSSNEYGYWCLVNCVPSSPLLIVSMCSPLLFRIRLLHEFCFLALMLVPMTVLLSHRRSCPDLLSPLVFRSRPVPGHWCLDHPPLCACLSI